MCLVLICSQNGQPIIHKNVLAKSIEEKYQQIIMNIIILNYLNHFINITNEYNKYAIDAKATIFKKQSMASQVQTRTEPFPYHESLSTKHKFKPCISTPKKKSSKCFNYHCKFNYAFGCSKFGIH